MDARDRAIVRLAVPALGTLAIEPLYVLVDTAIVGHLGTVPLGGLALATSVLNAAFVVFNFLAYGTTARVAFLVGSGDVRRGAGIAAQGLWLAAGFGVALIAILVVAARPVAALLGGHGAVLDAAVTYLRISAFGAPLFLVALVGNGYLRGVHDTRTPLWVVLAANLLNVVIEVVLVYGLHLGVAGSAWGTVIAQAVAAAWFLLILTGRIRAVAAGLRPVRTEIARLLRFGRHLFFRTGSLLATLTLATAVAARMGRTTLGGHQIAIQVLLFLALTVDALAIAAQALTGTGLGAGRAEETRDTGRRLLQLGLYVGVALGIAVVVTAGILPRLFTSDAAVRDRARMALIVVGILQVPAAAVFVLDGVLIGASDTRFQQWANLAAFAVFCPFAAVLLRFHRFGIVGLWVALSAWLLTRLVANWRRFAGPRWTAVSVADP